MPSSLTPDCGMITFHPSIEEYTPQIKHWFCNNDEFSGLFESYAIIEEKKSHLHIPFRVAYEHIGSHRDRFTKKITDLIPGDYRNKKVAVKISWPKKRTETFIEVLGYCFKGIVVITQAEQQTEILKLVNISDEDIEQAELSAAENNNEADDIITTPQIIKLCKKYFADRTINTKSLSGFTSYIARTGHYYLVRDATVESIYDQTLRIHRELALNNAFIME